MASHKVVTLIIMLIWFIGGLLLVRRYLPDEYDDLKYGIPEAKDTLSVLTVHLFWPCLFALSVLLFVLGQTYVLADIILARMASRRNADVG